MLKTQPSAVLATLVLWLNLTLTQHIGTVGGVAVVVCVHTFTQSAAPLSISRTCKTY